MFKSTVLNRRALLVGMASASAASVGAIPVSGVAASGSAESAELVRMGDMLPALAVEYAAADAADGIAARHALKLWPMAPDALALPYHSAELAEVGFDGGHVVRPGEFRARSIITAELIREDIARLRDGINGKRSSARFPIPGYGGRFTVPEWQSRIDDLQAMLPVAVAYEAAKEQALTASGMVETSAALSVCRGRLVEAVAAIMAITPVSMEGIAIQAQALATFGTLSDGERLSCLSSWGWGPTFAASVLRIAGEARG